MVMEGWVEEKGSNHLSTSINQHIALPWYWWLSQPMSAKLSIESVWQSSVATNSLVWRLKSIKYPCHLIFPVKARNLFGTLSQRTPQRRRFTDRFMDPFPDPWLTRNILIVRICLWPCLREKGNFLSRNVWTTANSLKPRWLSGRHALIIFPFYNLGVRKTPQIDWGEKAYLSFYCSSTFYLWYTH